MLIVSSRLKVKMIALREKYNSLAHLSTLSDKAVTFPIDLGSPPAVR